MGWTRMMLLALTLGGASLAVQAKDVKVDWDHHADFSGFKTYAWEPGTPAQNPLWDQRITRAIDEQLEAKGLQKVSPDANPDLVVIYHAAVGHETQFNTTNMGGWGYWGTGMSTTTVNKIPTGELIVDIGNAKTKTMIWIGTATDTLSDNPDKNQKKVEKAVDKMFKKFPPNEGK
jgi:hypothetical protein